MKIKSRIIKETSIRLTEQDSEQLQYEYGQLDNRLPLVRQIIAGLVGDSEAMPVRDYLD